jgi:hypothetical protein
MEAQDRGGLAIGLFGCLEKEILQELSTPWIQLVEGQGQIAPKFGQLGLKGERLLSGVNRFDVLRPPTSASRHSYGPPLRGSHQPRRNGFTVLACVRCPAGVSHTGM